MISSSLEYKSEKFSNNLANLWRFPTLPVYFGDDVMKTRVKFDNVHSPAYARNNTVKPGQGPANALAQLCLEVYISLNGINIQLLKK